MIAATLSELILEQRAGPFAVGDDAAGLDSIFDPEVSWNPGWAGPPDHGWYLFGDLEFFCERDEAGVMRIRKIKFEPIPHASEDGWTDRRYYEATKVFSFDREGLCCGQSMHEALAKLEKFGTRCITEFAGDPVYAVGNHAVANFSNASTEVEATSDIVLFSIDVSTDLKLRLEASARTLGK